MALLYSLELMMCMFTTVTNNVRPNYLSVRPKLSLFGHVSMENQIVSSALHDSLIEALVATGPHAGQLLIIPRIPFVLDDDVLSFQMQRKQFPI